MTESSVWKEISFYVSFCVLIGCLVFMKQRATSHELTTRVNRHVSRSTQSSWMTEIHAIQYCILLFCQSDSLRIIIRRLSKLTSDKLREMFSRWKYFFNRNCTIWICPSHSNQPLLRSFTLLRIDLISIEWINNNWDTRCCSKEPRYDC